MAAEMRKKVPADDSNIQLYPLDKTKEGENVYEKITTSHEPIYTTPDATIATKCDQKEEVKKEHMRRDLAVLWALLPLFH